MRQPREKKEEVEEQEEKVKTEKEEKFCAYFFHLAENVYRNNFISFLFNFFYFSIKN